MRRKKTLRPPHSTSRESVEVKELGVLTVRGATVWNHLPWLIDLCHSEFRMLAKIHANQDVFTARDKRCAVVMNAQESDGSRYECHVGSNPIEGLLYVTDHPQGDGGELVVAIQRTVKSVAEVDADCSIVYPVAGHLVLFDGRWHPYYVRKLAGSSTRVAIGMNYYTHSNPESSRPTGLNMDLYGED